jgi:WD40 repeat protein
MPRVYIYEVDIEYNLAVANNKEIPSLIPPKLKAYRILERGTLKAYSAMSFNKDGTKLATVGSFPDYMLTIWDWESQSIILRYKAFGQEVYNVSFSQNNDGQLTTSGSGHIKFWKMAETFTGLKLQGQIGKFGKIDISDIAGYVELPDGKVLSGSEQGNLLLWEGNLIKCMIVRVDGKPCHDGRIEVVLLDPKSNMFITAGADGYMRYWEFEAIDTREPDENSLVYLEPVMQVLVGEGVKVIALSRPTDGRFWIVQDANGALWRVSDYRSLEDERSGKSFVHNLYSFHAGPITGAVTSPYDHHVVTAGMDGTVRLYDYLHKLAIYYWRFSAGATCIMWNPSSVDPTQNTLTVGFANGVFRVLKRCEDNFELLKVSKPHTAAINAIGYNQSGDVFVTASKDSTLFFFDVRNNYRPFGFIKCESIPTCLAWKSDNMTLLVGFESGRVIEMNVDKTTVLDIVDSSQTYEFFVNYKVFLYHYILKPPPKKVKDEKNEETEVLDMTAMMHDKPSLVRKVLYSNDGTSIIISLEKEEEGMPSLFEFYSLGSSWLSPSELNKTKQEPEWPKKIISAREATCTSIGYSRSDKFMILGFSNGKISVVDLDPKITNELDR